MRHAYGGSRNGATKESDLALHRDRTELLAVIKLQAPVTNPAKAVRLFQNFLEYGCQVCWR